MIDGQKKASPLLFLGIALSAIGVLISGEAIISIGMQAADLITLQRIRFDMPSVEYFLGGSISLMGAFAIGVWHINRGM